MEDVHEESDQSDQWSAPPTAALEMCHVASWRSQICSAWSSNPHQEDGVVLENARSILMDCHSFLEEMFTALEVKSMLDPASTYTPRSALLIKTHREVASHELDAMPPELRAKGLAIRSSDLTAIPLCAAERAPPTMAHIGINRASKVEIHALSDGRLLLNATSQKGTKQYSYKPGKETLAACAALFSLPDTVAPPDKLPIVARTYPPQAEHKGPKYVEMPSWIGQRLGQVLQDGFRFHALLTAATDDKSRSVVIEKVLLCIPTSESKRSCELLVRMHSSSGTCICNAHQKAPAASGGHIQVLFAFCGKLYTSSHNRRCIRHAECAPNFAPELPVACLHNFSARVICKHIGVAKHYNFTMDIPDDCVERLRIVAAASIALVDKQKEEAIPIKEAVDAVFGVGEASEVPASAGKINRDMLAVGLLRVGGVERTIRNGQPSLSGNKLSGAAHGLRTTHSQLFKKRYGKR
jgi:hypothetical protein